MLSKEQLMVEYVTKKLEDRGYTNIKITNIRLFADGNIMADVFYTWRLNAWEKQAEHKDEIFIYKDGKWYSPLIGGIIMSKTNTYTMRINFFWDDGDDIWNFKIIVPENVTINMVEEVLIKSHEILDNDGIDEEDENYGKCQSCKHYGNGNYCSNCVEGSEYETDAEDLYGTSGRNPVTLIDYVCKKYGWKWEDLVFDFDIDLNFN